MFIVGGCGALHLSFKTERERKVEDLIYFDLFC